MATDTNITIVEELYKKGSLLGLYIGRPTFQKKLKPNNVFLEGKINEEAFYLGHKKLLSKEATARFITLEGQARLALANRSLHFPFGGGRFVSFNALPDLLTRLRAIRDEWHVAVQTLVSTYSELQAEQLEVLDKQSDSLMQAILANLTTEEKRCRKQEIEDWLVEQRAQHREQFPAVDTLASKFYFYWYVTESCGCSITNLTEMSASRQDALQGELRAANEAMQSDLRSWVRTATADMHKALGDAASQAKDLLEKQGKLHPKNLRPLFEAFETFSAIDFTNSNWKNQIEAARERFIMRDADGVIDFERTSEAISGTQFATTEFKSLLNAVGSLAIQQVAEEASKKAISRVGAFRRFVEV